MQDQGLLVTPLGVGRAFTRRLRHSNFLLEDGGDLCCLLDCGFTAPHALDDLGLFERIDVVILTHCHLDHVGGLEEFAVRRALADLPAPLLVAPDPVVEQLNTMFTSSLRWVGAGRPFTVAGGPEAGRCHLRWHRMDPHGLNWRTRLELGGATFDIGAFPVDHVPHMPCFGYDIHRHGANQGQRVVFSGDTAHPIDCDCVAEADVIFHDIGDDPVHAAPEAVARALGAAVERTLGYHYADDAEPGPITLAEQGHRYEVAAGALVR